MTFRASLSGIVLWNIEPFELMKRIHTFCREYEHEVIADSYQPGLHAITEETNSTQDSTWLSTYYERKLKSLNSTNSRSGRDLIRWPLLIHWILPLQSGLASGYSSRLVWLDSVLSVFNCYVQSASFVNRLQDPPSLRELLLYTLAPTLFRRAGFQTDRLCRG